MKKRKMLTTLLPVVLGGIFISQPCFADVITVNLPYYDSPIGVMAYLFVINSLLEVFFGWLIFFRSNKRGIVAILLVNIISHPIAMLSFYYIAQEAPRSMAWFLLVIVEMIVVIFEMLVYKTVFKEISYLKACLISISLNLISLFLGYIVFGIIVSLSTSSGGGSWDFE